MLKFRSRSCGKVAVGVIALALWQCPCFAQGTSDSPSQTASAADSRIRDAIWYCCLRINGATAFSGTPYFTANPGDKFGAWDASLTFDYMPSQFATFRWEYNHRRANVPYFSGSGGITPPGGNTGPAGLLVPGFSPDLRKAENRLTFAVLVKM